MSLKTWAAQWFKPRPPEFITELDGFSNDLTTVAEIMRLTGVAFGPPGLRHWSKLKEQERRDLLAACPVLNDNHSDWPFLKWMPRTLTTYLGPPAGIIEGNAPSPKPIPDKGQWWVGDGFMTMQTTGGFHFRVGFRPDDVETAKYQAATGRTDWLFEISVTFKKYK
jgi:hypothetical protein